MKEKERERQGGGIEKEEEASRLDAREEDAPSSTSTSLDP